MKLTKVHAGPVYPVTTGTLGDDGAALPFTLLVTQEEVILTLGEPHHETERQIGVIVRMFNGKVEVITYDRERASAATLVHMKLDGTVEFVSVHEDIPAHAKETHPE